MQIGTNGSGIIIEFERNGEHHKTVRWSSDTDFVETCLSECCLGEIRSHYARHGATVLAISRIEVSKIALD